MSQTFVENKICGICGADVRPNALFCYNCGGALIIEKQRAEETPENSLPPKVEQEVIKREPEQTVSMEDTELSPVKENDAIKESERNENSESNRKPDLKSAASLRRKSKSLDRKIVEVVWEEHENAPNALFISVALLLAIIAAVILFLAIYLK